MSILNALSESPNTKRKIVSKPIGKYPYAKEDEEIGMTMDVRKRLYYSKRVSFSKALDGLMKGRRIRRDAWQPGVFIVRQKGYPDGIPSNKQTAEAWGIEEGDLFCCQPYLQMRQADGTHTMWTPNTMDLFATDWEVIQDWESIVV